MRTALLAVVPLALLAAPAGAATRRPQLMVVNGFAYGGEGADLAGATVTVRDAAGKRIGGWSHTNELGAFVVRAPELRAATERRRLWISTTGGRMHGKPFSGSLRAVVEGYAPEDVVHLNYVTTAVAYDFTLDRWGGLGQAERRVRSALGIPAAVNLGSHLRHTTTTVAPSLVEADIRRLGSLGAWLRFVDTHAHRGTPTPSYAAKHERPAVGAAQDAPGAALSALDASRSDCSTFAARKAGPGAGWGIADVASAARISLLGAAHSYLTSNDSSCVASARLDRIVGQLQDVETQLGTLEARIGDLEQKLRQLHPATWRQLYGAGADRLVSLRGTLTAVGAVEQAYDRYELFVSDPKDQTSESANSLLDLIHPLIAQYQAVEDRLLPAGATSIGLYEGAWRQIRAGGDRYVTQSQIDDFKTLRDYWLSLGTEMATLVAEYEHARAGMSPVRYDAWLHGKKTGAGPETLAEVAADIHDAIAAAASYPQVSDLPGYDPAKPLAAQPNLPMYDPNSAYREWDGAGFAPQPGLLWQGFCGNPWSDPGDTERTDVRIGAGTCTVGRWTHTMADDLHGADSCAQNLPILNPGGAVGSWLPVTRDQLNVLMSEHRAGTRLSDWLGASSPWFRSILNPALPVAYSFFTGDGTCPYGRHGRISGQNSPSSYRSTGDRHVTISPYHLAASDSSGDDWLCQPGQEVDPASYTCPFHGPNSVAASFVVRPPAATERFVPWVADPATGRDVMDFPAR